MTDTPSDETKSIARRLSAHKRTLTIGLCLLLILAPVGVVVAQSADVPPTRWDRTTDVQDIDAGPGGEHIGVANNSGYIVLWDGTDGADVWSYQQGNSTNRVSTGNDSVFYTTDDDSGTFTGFVGALDKSTGTLDWEDNSSDNVPSILAHDSQDVYVAHGTGDVTARDAGTGTVQWSVPSPSGFVTDLATAPDGSEVYATAEDTLIAYDASTGAELWNATYPMESVNSFNMDVSPDGNTIFLAGTDPQTNDDADLYAVDSNNGAIIWRDDNDAGSGSGSRYIQASPDGETLYAGGYPDGGTIEVMSASNGLVDTVWEGDYEQLSVSADGSTLYAVRIDGSRRVIAIDTGGGHELSGSVTDQRNQAVGGATIVANGTNENDSTVTAEDGSYSMTLLNGTYNVTAYKDGYVSDSVTLTVDDETTQDFTLIEEDAALSIRARHFMEHGESAPYSVTYGEIDSSGNFVREDVTNSTTAISNNSTVVTVNTITQELGATSDESVNTQTYVTFNYTNDAGETFSREHEVTVANATVENLDILPPVTKFTATLGDKTMQTVLIATGVAVVAAILAGAFSGIAAFTVIMCMGWVMGIVPDGTIIVTVLTAIFVGLNIAGNVDYTVQR